MMKATTDKPKKRSNAKPRRWIEPPQLSARNVPAVQGVELTENENVRWTWTHTANGSSVSGYRIVKLRRLRTSVIKRLGRVALAAALTMPGASFAFCGEIHDAARTGDVEKVRTLLKTNPDLVNAKEAEADSFGRTPLHWAVAKAAKEVIELLLANNADVNAKDSFGSTPLHEAAGIGNKEVIEVLFANKADANIKNTSGKTPLHRAAAKGHKDMAELLLSHNAEVNARDREGMTPLPLAGGNGREAVATVLLSKRAQVNARDINGLTPLHTAAVKGHKADINAKDITGEIPLAAVLHWQKILENNAKMRGDNNAVLNHIKETVDFLRAHGAME